MRTVKRKHAARITKRALKIAGALAAIGLVAYLGTSSGKSSLDAQLTKSYDNVQTINQFMSLKGDEIFGTALYNDELKELVYVKDSEGLYKTLGGQNNTILSDKQFKKFFMNEREENGSPGSGLVKYLDGDARERTDPEAYAALMYATMLNSPERKALESKGRFGIGLISREHLGNLLNLDQEEDKSLERFRNDFDNAIFTARSLKYFLMQSQGEVYTALAYYFIGKDVVDKARASVDGEISNDINQYWEYLPEGSEKTLLAKAIGFYESCKVDKHNKFIQSAEWKRAKKVIENDLLLWEYKYREYHGDLKPGKEMIKIPEYKRFLKKYHNKEFALIACYDEAVLKTAIAAASKTHVRTISEFIPSTLQREGFVVAPEQIEGWMGGYGFNR